MKICPNCNKQFDDNAKFCEVCGVALEAVEAEVTEVAETEVLVEAEVAEVAAEAEELQPVETAEVEEAEKIEEIVAEAAAEVTETAEVTEATEAVEETATVETAEKKKFDIKALLDFKAIKEKLITMPKKQLNMIVACGLAVLALILLVVIVASAVSAGKEYVPAYTMYLQDDQIFYNKFSGKSKLVIDEVEDGNTINSMRLSVSQDGKLLFYIEDGELYFKKLNKKDATRIDKGVTTYHVNEDATIVTYEADGNLYQYKVKKGDKSKIDNDVDNFWVSEDGKEIRWYTDDGDLYYKKGNKDGEKLDSDISSVEYITEDFEVIYYTKDDDFYKCVKTKDEQKISSDVTSVVRVYESGEAYFKKADDDGAILCYYNGKKVTEIEDSEGASIIQSVKEKPVVAFGIYDGDDTELFVAVKGKLLKTDVENAETVKITDDGKKLYYVSEYDSEDAEGELYEAKISGSKVSKAKLVADGVYATIVLPDNDRVIYFTDYSGGEAELNVNGKKIMDDVVVDYILCSDDGKVAFIADYDEDDLGGILYVMENKKAKKVSADVTMMRFAADGTLIIIKDVSDSSGEAALYIATGTKAKKVAEDISGIYVGTANSHDAKAYFG